jgi:cysteine synthase A
MLKTNDLTFKRFHKMYIESVIQAIGNTPLMKLSRISECRIFAKLELLNPGGSIKDRIARYLIEKAAEDGILKPGSIIVEASSGNTGIGMALVGVQKGYRVIIVMPENMSEERKKIIRALGGELVMTSTEEGLEGCLKKVYEMRDADPEVWVPQQFENPLNPEIHYLETAAEIWEQMESRVDAFVAGVGSGGTLQGVGRFLKEKNPDILAVAVEPENSAALLGHEPGLHQIQGIGDGFIPAVLDVEMIDEVITVSDQDAIEMSRKLARVEGLLAGTSSGANVWAAINLAEKIGADKRIVTVLADRAERYFSTSLI